jgi:hypothetical protein
MMIRQKWSLFLLPITLALALQIRAAEGADIFANDRRLAKPIRVGLKDVSVTFLLTQVTQITSVPLLWDKEIGNLRASVFVQLQPASGILTHLAMCLRLAWKREADGYRLYRPTAVTREDERRRRQWEEERAKQREALRQMDEFTAALLRQHHLTDEEVKKLAAKFPHVAKILEEEPWFVVGMRVVTWLTPEQWSKAIDQALELDYKEWTLTGPDPNLPVPEVSPDTVKLIEATLRQQGQQPETITIQRQAGKSGINSIWVTILRDGRLSVEVRYVITGGFGHIRTFIFGSARGGR